MMMTMSPEIQSWAAAGIVALTAAAFALRSWRRRGRAGTCSGGCACPGKPGIPGREAGGRR